MEKTKTVPSNTGTIQATIGNCFFVVWENKTQSILAFLEDHKDAIEKGNIKLVW